MILKDKIAEEVLKVITEAGAPLETKEVFEKLKTEMNEVSRSKIMYRLTMLRGDGEIHGKSVGSGKGVWIWWKSDSNE